MARSAYSILRGICIRLMSYSSGSGRSQLARSRGWRRRGFYREDLLYVLDQHIVFDIHRVAYVFETQGRRAKGVRNQLDGKVAIVERKNSQADSVDGDRAFLDQVTGLRGLDFEGEKFRIALRTNRHD